MSPDDHTQAARAIERQHPGWMVEYGFYTRQYVALPLFTRQRGMVLAATDPPVLSNQIQQAERRIFIESLRRGEL